MEYYIYKHRWYEVDVSLDLKTVKETTDIAAKAGHYCKNCGTFTLGEWEFPSYNIVYPPNRMSYQKYIVEGESYEELTPNNIIYNYFCNGDDEWDEKKIIKHSSNRNHLDDDVRNDLIISLKNIPDFIRQYREEMLNVLKMQKCPICGEEYILGKKPKYIDKEFEGIDDCSEDAFFLAGMDYCYLFNYEDDIEDEYRKLSEKKFTQFIKKAENTKIESVDGIELKDLKTLKSYLNNIISIEKEIYLVSSRLKELYFVDLAKEKDSVASKMISCLEMKSRLEELENNFENIANQKLQIEIESNLLPPEKPQKPTAPTKPEKPVLQKPGLFNKKKIGAENELLIKKFEKAMSDYETLYSEYEELCIKYKVELETYYKKDEEVKKEIETKRQLINKELNVEYEKLLAEYENSINSSNAIITQETVIADVVHNEVVLAEELLQNLYKARKKAYAYGVIFEKYRDFVAVSMFFEYLSSGRCTTLEGPDGAYNLYESELRANIIISKLTEITNQLEEIKKNQFVIYNAINEVSKQLASLSSSMETAIDSLSDIDDHLTNIEGKTELIAHNTEVTAFYAKKNAELTNALGYLIALS